ncbi:alpha/beta hydrolase fold domain-containing protein [Rhodopila sp.]|uniref:alpha/beta hydrolase fold domain-containing protein n=1 Tax=Rhodopila sp. TaxID=2480087 RepID=UPI003D0FDE10
MSSQASDYTVADFNYIEHRGVPQRLRLFMPTGPSVGAGPFPLVVDIHGGAWCNGDLKDCEARDLALVGDGFAVAAVNFRHAGEGYPASSVDINYAIRWLKAHAGKLGLKADKVGLSGQSSGGHLAMLAAMRPADPRYIAIPSPHGVPGDIVVDASVQAVVMQWPVINPLSRYRNAVRLRDSAQPPAWVGDIPDRHDLYWKTEAVMQEGNPMLILERGEKVPLPPALWIQGKPDPIHDYRDPDGTFDGNEPERFAHDYRAAGGSLELLSIDNATRATASIEPTAAFFQRHLS